MLHHTPLVLATRTLPWLLAAACAGLAHAAAPAPVPVLPPTAYDVKPTELIDIDRVLNSATVVTAELPGAAAKAAARPFTLRGDVVSAFAPGTFVPGRSYTLRVKARVKQGSQDAVVAVRFRRLYKNETYRIYKTTFKANEPAEETIHFTAPAYASSAELAVLPQGGEVQIEELSLKMREPVAPTEPIASTEGSFVPAGYALAFNDEFNGTALNRSKWFTRYIYESGTLDHLKSEKQRFRDNDNHQVANGVLRLVARKTAKPGMYESGMIRSDWATRYGYFEARIKLPGGKGVFPAFWLNGDADEKGEMSWPPEIDIFEFVHNGKEEKPNMIHSGVVQQKGTKREFLYTAPGFNTQWKYWRAPYNFPEGWHTFGAEWTPDSVTTFVDGMKLVTFAYQWKFTNGQLAGPAHVLLNLSIGGDWAGKYGIDDSAFPQAMQVDWVRVYKKPD